MAFTVEDFHDLIELLAQRPEWRAELRRHVLSDELLELPALVRQLVEAQARTEARVAELVEAQARAEARLEHVEARMDDLQAAIQSLAQAQARTELQLAELAATTRRLDDRQGQMDGTLLEHDFGRRAPSTLYPIARRLRVIESSALADLLDSAIDEGGLTERERQDIMRADVVLSGRRRSDGQEVYLLTEVSVGIGPHDVERAAERAVLLEKLGRPVIPVAAGRRIDEATAKLAYDRGVWYAIGGILTAPRGA